MPGLSTLQPVNATRPADAASGFVPHVRVAAPGTVSVRVTALLAPVTVLPDASRTVTTGWVARAVPPVPLPGWVVNARLLAAAGVMVKDVLVAEASPEAVAVSV